ncbi:MULTISPECIES: molybdopterin molybdotransferase MoeA [unclassified Colwellia]|uniref:molybdopterin molybdotransferase MoeA n=1 Tax=unclassified Colwellia TaxID=196834 RepID=UPI0015F3AD7A|nr:MULTISPECIES: molybdopterin molybdotransferase MoeA [unclassified Colwellia]MBA6350665.1 molybdopterin molybdotransferase MoeA [Colwellia sp. BRX9-1]MBA6354281.1 molybdopterin molybdotransferase MoeA [Colwellia sp. BRX8-3]MBA6358452.1 molybdopterin molybdotransferase MoeA [Colwellia sp. BRX8-6]MBA6367846.1 molybdopterin molybdotransferase MoeA [Colwellia sp. BRX8-5]MBA6374327.1 molybdopterin molybdotransferase MoeA [Colwellia sp. BRX8-2]
MVDCCSAPGLLPFEQAMEKMLSAITPIDKTESVSLALGLNRVLARNISSPLNVPPHHNSAMDGYAFKWASLQTTDTLTMIGRSMAGAPFQGECKIGECIRIMTGAKLPSCCDTVEMQENCQAKDTGITFLENREFNDNIRFTGEDIAIDQPVFSRGKKLSAIDIGVLASLGVPIVEVYRKITVAVLATGDELKSPGEVLNDGDIYESNSHALIAMLTKLNVTVINFGIIADDEQAIRTAFEQADQQADVVISSGGVSVGDADYTKLILEQLGEIGFWKIAMKPGKPFAFGKLPNSYFFGLPGNPVSALVTAHQLAVPALLKLQHAQAKKLPLLKVKTATQLNKRAGRMDFQRAILSTNHQGEMIVTSTGSQGSGILTSMSTANCYIVLPANQGNVPANEMVNVQLFDDVIQ